MNCDAIRDLLPRYVRQDLAAAEKQRVAEHLTRCPDCSRALLQWRVLAEGVRDLAGENAGGLPPLPGRMLDSVPGGRGLAVGRRRWPWLALALLATGLLWQTLERQDEALEGRDRPSSALVHPPATSIARRSVPRLAVAEPPADPEAPSEARRIGGEMDVRSAATGSGPNPAASSTVTGTSSAPSGTDFAPSPAAATLPFRLPSETPTGSSDPTGSGSEDPTATLVPTTTAPASTQPSTTSTATPAPPIATGTNTAPGPTATRVIAIRGRVLGLADGLPRVEIRVRAWRVDAADSLEARSDLDGRFELPAEAGQWLVAAGSDQLTTLWWSTAGGALSPYSADTLTLAAGGEMAEIELGLERSGAAIIEGRVLDVEGHALAGSLVVAVAEGGEGDAASWGPAVISADDGSYRLRLPAGRYRIGTADRIATDAWPKRWWPAAAAIESAELIEALPGSPVQGLELQLP